MNLVFRGWDLQVLREDGERVFCRGWQSGDDGSAKSVLIVLAGSAGAPPAGVDRLAHEYALKDVLDGGGGASAGARVRRRADHAGARRWWWRTPRGAARRAHGDSNVLAHRRNLNTNVLAVGDPLIEAQREAERGFAFAEKSLFGFVSDIVAGQLGLIRTLRGFTRKFGCFDDGQFHGRSVRATPGQ